MVIKKAINLSYATQHTLEWTAPMWMAALKFAKYDMRKLSFMANHQMAACGDKCFIGEIHEGQHYGTCSTCMALARIAPYVFHSKSPSYSKDMVFQNLRLDHWNTHGFKHTSYGVKKFLNYTARHIKKCHPERIKEV